ncbi:MAG TPA: GNAT family N-acetyltransferase [Terriglobales bacterium]|nr:GNAT family N-acetyltransferase [Terriglobales bacterium]
MLRSVIIENLQDLQRIRPLWEELATQPGMTMFQSYDWNAAALKVFGQREIPRLVYVESDAGVALVPSVVGQRCRKVHLAGEALFDYRTALVAGDSGVLAKAWERMAEWGMAFEAKALRGDAKDWTGLEVKFFANAPRLRASADADEFVRSRNRLGRFTRRFRRAGVEYRRRSGADKGLVRHIYEKKAEQDVGTNLFRDPLRREFMMTIAASPDTHCDIFTYESVGGLVAALVTFRDGNVRRFYTTYFDQRWAKQSPGQVLLFEATADSLREGLECDYMTGEYLYKNRFADEMVPLYQLRATPEQLRAAGRRVSEPIAA